MKRLVRRRDRGNGTRELNITPLIDMVFILLIFFLVTTSFVRETGIEVNRPLARTAEQKDKTSLLIGVDPEGLVYIGGHTVDIRNIRAQVNQYLAATPEGAVVIVADQDASTGLVIRILDECRASGVRDLSLAARQPSR